MAAMKATVLGGAGDIHVIDVPQPQVTDRTDAIVRILRAAVCGSDLWAYRGVDEMPPGSRTGHEWIGIVEDIGADVARVLRGDLVVAPFAYADGTCVYCREGWPTSCPAGGIWGGAGGGGQAEAIRVPYADATLVPVRADPDDGLLRRLLPLTDVMATGLHGTVCAGVAAGSTTVVVGDGAVGLCAVLAARRAGAERIIILGRHPERLRVAESFGATDALEAGDPAVANYVVDATDGGATAVVECVGTQSSLDLALAVARPGGAVGAVGAPYGVRDVDLYRFFRANVALRPGLAPVRRYLDTLVDDVLNGTLDPSPVFDLEVDLAGIATAYRAMDRREAIKALVRCG